MIKILHYLFLCVFCLNYTNSYAGALDDLANQKQAEIAEQKKQAEKQEQKKQKTRKSKHKHLKILQIANRRFKRQQKLEKRLEIKSFIFLKTVFL